MCCCGKPNVNGTPGAYSWDGKSFMTREVNPPSLTDGDTLLYDEPGRCGGLDCHSHHFRLTSRYGSHAVLVRHGGGDERFYVSRMILPAFEALDSNGRYWLMHTLYSAYSTGREQGTNAATSEWRLAAAEKRIKTRKVRGRGAVKVWIEPKREAGA